MTTRDDSNVSNGVSRAPERQRLHDGFRDDRRYLSQMVGEGGGERTNRIEAVLELKQDLEASSARIGVQNAMARAKEEAVKAEQARTHQDLVNQGKNPYEIARRKVVEREARKERSRIEKNIQNRESKLLNRLQAEKAETRRRETVEAKNRAYERKYQREMGRAAQEERTNAYLLSRTGRDTLDPTGKLVRVYPSQETTIKDGSFGLGHSAVRTSEQRRRIVAKVHAKSAHVGTGASQILLPRQRNRQVGHDSEQFGEAEITSSRTEGENDAGLKATERLIIPPLPGAKPGQDLRKVNHALLPSSSDVKLPPISGVNSRRSLHSRDENDEDRYDIETQSKRKKPRGRSVLEERQLTKARQRQQDARFTQSQVVLGKEFTGNAFLANPPLLWFKDFDVGRPLSLSFTLTNVSNTFNQFRLLAMEDEVRELFDIVYDKPGRMSAGMSCSLRMTFTGIERRDLDTTLSVASPTGVIQVPVRCTCKKAVPVLDKREIRFPEIVAGERTTIALRLTNEGALPLEFRVRRIPSSPSKILDVLPLTNAPVVIDNNEEKEDEVDATEKSDVVDGVNGNLEEPQENSESNAGPEFAESEQPVVQSVNDEIGADDPDASASVNAIPTNTVESDIAKMIEGKEEEELSKENELLNQDEQELLDRACELTLFRPEGADEPIRFTKRGLVGPYTSSNVSFTFAPAAALILANEQFVVEFSTPESSGVSSPDLRRLSAIPLCVTGVASQVPVYASCSRLDFRCCAYGKLYRHQLQVCNRGKVALKVQVQVPTPLAGCLEFNPGFGFVQAAAAKQDGQFPMQVKFRPQERMWKRVERAGLGSRALGMIAVPVSVLVPDQVVPVFFVLTARLTPMTLEFKTSSRLEFGSNDKQLHFGSCCVGHSVSQELAITNPGRVPQRVGITTLPKDVIIADVSAGVGIVLLPGESYKLLVVFQPSVPGELKAVGLEGRAKPTLVIWSSTCNQEYVLPCTGVGVASDLIFSHSAVRLGATSLGQSQTCSVMLSNSSDCQTLLAELRLPPEASSFLRITPLVARLAPHESVRLEIDFEPTDGIFNVVENSYFEGKLSEDTALEDNNSGSLSARSVHADISDGVPQEALLENVENDGEESDQVVQKSNHPEERRSCHHTWTVLCFQQPEVSDEKNSSQPILSPPLKALEVRTTALEPFVSSSERFLDFGRVAIGQIYVHELVLETTATATDSVKLRAEPLHVLGAFNVIGALREVPGPESKRKRVIRVQFEPSESLVYEDELELSSTGTRIRVRLRGEGINPDLSLNPPDGKIDFQDVLARTRTVRELVLTNGSAFPLTFSIIAADAEDHQVLESGKGELMTASTGLPVFTFSPTSATIPAEGSVTVQVVFQPDHQRPGHYSRRFRIKVPNKNEKHIVSLCGRCWENQLYVFAPTANFVPQPTDDDRGRTLSNKRQLLAPLPVEDLFDVPPSIPLSRLAITAGANSLPGAGLRKPSSTFVLTFDGDDSNRNTLDGTCSSENSTSGGRITQTLFVGSTAPSSGIYGGLDDVAAGSGAATVTAGGSAGTFELIVDAASSHASLFTLEPSRGAIAAGQQLAVQVTYQPPILAVASALGTKAAAPGELAQSARRRPELEVAQWTQVRVQCVLKGGALWRTATTTSIAAGGTGSGQQQKGGSNAAGGDTDTRIVTVLLRARLQT